MKRFCLRGHDTAICGRRPNGGMCKTCWLSRRHIWDRRYEAKPEHKARRNAYDRRKYLELKPIKNAQAKKWRKENPVRSSEIRTKNRLKYRGVNFWVEAARESL